MEAGGCCCCRRGSALCHSLVCAGLCSLQGRQTAECVCSVSPLAASFYNLPSVNDFIIDILLGSSSGEVLGRSVPCLSAGVLCGPALAVASGLKTL